MELLERRPNSPFMDGTDAGFRLLFAGNPLPMWVFDRHTLAFLEVNEAAIRRYGYTRDEFLAMRITDIRPSEDEARVRQSVERRPATLNTAGVWRHRLKDGRLVDVEITSNALPFQGCDAVLVVAQDVTARREAERRLEESQQRYKSLFDNNSDAIGSLDMQGRWVSGNAAAVGLTGYRLRELMGMSFLSLVAQEDWDTALTHFHLAQQSPQEIEVRLIRKDGSAVDARISGQPMAVEGATVGVYVLAKDVTLQKAAERANAQWNERLQREQQRLDDLLQSVPCVVWEIWTEPDAEKGRINYVSGYVEMMLGYSPQEWLADPEFWLTVVHPDDREQTRLENERHLAGGQGGVSRYRCIARDGRVVWVEATSVVVKDAGGKSMGMRGVKVDITERKRAEEALQASEQRYRMVERATNDVIWDWNINTDVVRWNNTAQKVFLYPAASFVNDNNWWKDRIHPEDRARVLGSMDAVVESGDVWVEEYRFLRGDGVYGTFLDRGYVLRSDGKAVRMLGSTMDVTERRAAEEALQESEQRYRMVARATNDVIWDWDLRTGVMQWSDSLVTQFGYGQSDLLADGQWWYDRAHTDDRDPIVRDIHAVIDGDGHSWSGEYRFQRADGTFAVVFDRGYVLRNSHGTPTRMIGAMVDISERKAAEDATNRREQEFRTLAENSPDIITRFDRDLCHVYINPAVEKASGIPASRFIGKTLEEVTPPDAPSGLWRRHLRRVFETGQETALEYDYPSPGRQRVYHTRLIPEFAKDGTVETVLSIARDITGRKHIEESTRFLAEASRTVAVSLDDKPALEALARLSVPFLADYCCVDVLEDGGVRRLAVAHADPDKEKILRRLQQRYYSQPIMPVARMRPFLEGRPQLLRNLSESDLRAFARDEDHLADLRVLGPKSMICAPMTAHGRSLGVIYFVSAESGRAYTREDMALAQELAQRAAVALENARLYREIRHADTAKDEFLAMLGHELRNPLGVISNALQLIHLRGLEGPPALHRTLDVVDRQAKHMARLVDDLLDVSRITQGKITLRQEHALIADVLEQAIQAAHPLMDARSHTLSVDISSMPMEVDADPVRIAQVVGNLLTNAAKYTEPGGHVSLAAAPENGHAVIRVSDSGAGIPPDLLPRVFDLFTQADRTLDRAQGGLGIGLTVVKNLVEMHGGAVEAYSDGVGKGSEFLIRLPLAEGVGSQVLGVGSGPNTQHLRPNTLRVLLVEDNVDAARTLSEILEMWGCAVQMAHDGPTALEIAERHAADVVLLDIGLPGMDGYEVARRLREQEGADGMRRAHLVALTGYGQEDDQRRSQAAGFDQHIVKPVDFPALEKLLMGLKPAPA